jgi:hypothetical protein
MKFILTVSTQRLAGARIEKQKIEFASQNSFEHVASYDRSEGSLFSSARRCRAEIKRLATRIGKKLD